MTAGPAGIATLELGASAAFRDGFQRLVAKVNMGRPWHRDGAGGLRGMARINTDWHRLLEICALADALTLMKMAFTIRRVSMTGGSNLAKSLAETTACQHHRDEYDLLKPSQELSWSLHEGRFIPRPVSSCVRWRASPSRRLPRPHQTLSGPSSHSNAASSACVRVRTQCGYKRARSDP
jgi:hypothetical protein